MHDSSLKFLHYRIEALEKENKKLKKQLEICQKKK